MGPLDWVNSALPSPGRSAAFRGVRWRFDVGGPVHPSRAGVTGQDGALRLAPLYACVRIIAEGVAKLPVNQYRDTGNRPIKLPPGQLLAKPSAYLRPFDWKVVGMTSALLHGMGYGYVTVCDGYGYARRWSGAAG